MGTRITADVFATLAKSLTLLVDGANDGAVVRGQFVLEVYNYAGEPFPFLIEWDEQLSEYVVIRSVSGS